MFDYKLKGKHIIIQFDPQFLPHLKYAGIDGTPLYAKVFRQEESGLWLDTQSFPFCPRPSVKPRVVDGEEFCHAHIFVPKEFVLSVVVFPSEMPKIERDPQVHTIGFKAKMERKKRLG
jgi:hypothetical protein